MAFSIAVFFDFASNLVFTYPSIIFIKHDRGKLSRSLKNHYSALRKRIGAWFG
jgi:hypothetical protein